jgi:transcriptional regulator with XRE-family HTH domain/tetratricopeptide (TPR) repeat protein
VVGQLMTFGAELRRMRMAAGLSLAELADRVHYSKGYLSKIETGRQPASADVAMRCDATLDASGELAALAARSAQTSASSVDDLDHDVTNEQAWVVTLIPDGGSRFASMSRRQALVAGTATLIGFSLPAPAMPTPAGDEAIAGSFWSMFDHFRQLGQVMSPGVVLPGLIAQTHTLRSLAATVSPAARQELLLLAARYAEYTGWMAQESGDDQAAIWWTAQAVGMAAGLDPDLAAYALVRRALITFYRDDADQTLRLARQAQADLRVAPRIRGLAAQREAQGHALAGDYGNCRKALDRAAVLLDGAVRPGGPASAGPGSSPLGPKAVADQVAIVTGWCYYDLGRPREAAEILERETARIPQNARRAWTRYNARLALAYAAASEIDRACLLAERVVDGAALTDSATIRLDLARLARTLSRWRNHIPVRELSPRLTQVLRTHVA